MKIALLTGGGDRPYSLGLLSCLLSKDIDVDFIGSDEPFDPERMGRQGVRFLNFYYKILGKKLVHTAHNINQGERDGKNFPMNRWTLKIMYGQMDHIFVHTTKMKEQLCREFSVPEVKVTVIPFGINNTVPIIGMTSKEAREHLGLRESDKVLLFFGNIAAYKGLETLIHALVEVRTRYPEIRLIIAGRVKGEEAYWGSIRKEITKNHLEPIILEKIEFIPDDQVERYYKAADLSIRQTSPKRSIAISGVICMGDFQETGVTSFDLRTRSTPGTKSGR